MDAKNILSQLVTITGQPTPSQQSELPTQQRQSMTLQQKKIYQEYLFKQLTPQEQNQLQQLTMGVKGGTVPRERYDAFIRMIQQKYPVNLRTIVRFIAFF